MVIGNGLVANALKNARCNNDSILFFASGVSNSSETNVNAFMREQILLEENITFANNNNMKLVYFSSCALIDQSHLTIPYYQHKFLLERLICEKADQYMIFRLPQLIGKSENKNTLINYLLYKIKLGENFELWKKATRYLIEIDDLKNILNILLLEENLFNQVLDIANPYRYSIEEIVNTIANYVNIQPNYTLIDKGDYYLLDLERFLNLLGTQDFDFGKKYLEIKLKKIL